MQKSDFFTAQRMDPEDLDSVEYLRQGAEIKVVVHLQCAYFEARLLAGETVYADTFNDREPYDALTHIFCVPQDALPIGGTMRFAALDSAVNGDLCVAQLSCTPQFADPDALFAAYNSGIEPMQTVSERIASGLRYSHLQCMDRENRPVQVFLLEADPHSVRFYTGTPDDGYAARGCCATVPEMIETACAHGQNVLAAVNADFFDMFGDNSPSGLCVKNGRVVANGESVRPFFGVLADGTPVITSLGERPELRDQLDHAAAGLQWILRDGAPYQWGPLEPFAYVRHPRTAAGLRADGTVLLMVVDGRIPDYSNGATLVDLIVLMQRFGAVQAINLDGGGSSILYTRTSDGYRLRTNPADLYRPTEKLIRPCFDCILITACE